MLYFRTFLFAIALLIFNLGQAQAFSLPSNFHTPSTPLVLEPRFSSSIKVAGVYWLPDYLENNLDFSDRQDSVNCDNPKESDYNPNHPACKKIDDRECEGLGYKIPSFVTDWSKYNYTEFSAANKVRCYKNFSCKAGFSKSSCPQWYQLAGNSCRDTRGTFYERCDPKPCPSSYTAGRTSCSPAAGYNYSSNGYSGAQICGRCDAKACAKGYSTSVTSCSKGYSFATNGMSGSLNCGICNQRPCSDGGYYDSNPNSGIYKCSNITWGSKTCQSCYQPQCSEGGYDAGDKGSNYVCTPTGYYGRTCYSCRVKNDTCSSGSKTACNSNQAPISTSKTEAGSICYLCRAKTCTDGGYVTSCPGGQKGTSVSYAGLSCLSNCICATSCVHKVTSKPANSHYTTSSCTACGVTTTIQTGWACNPGYNQSGNFCVAACTLPTCTDSVTSKPANSYYITASCTDCSGTKTVNTGWKCNPGYSQSGSSCAKDEKTCADGGYFDKKLLDRVYLCTSVSYEGKNCFSCKNCGSLGNRENYDSSVCTDSGYGYTTREDNCGRTVYKCSIKPMPGFEECPPGKQWNGFCCVNAGCNAGVGYECACF